jgi:5-formyltetrahydrofolate cyclo-ligase
MGPPLFMSQDPMPDAATLRPILMNRRDQIPEDERARKSDEIWKRLAEVPEFQMAEQALFYISHRSEVDTTFMRRLAREMGLSVCAPRSSPGSRHMQFYVLPEDEPFVSGPYGILQPPDDLPKADLSKPSVVLVPGVGFDRHGNRLGFGGGYYDRWLVGDGKGLPTVALAFDEQVLDAIPVKLHDVPVHLLVTDKETVDCRLSPA